MGYRLHLFFLAVDEEGGRPVCDVVWAYVAKKALMLGTSIAISFQRIYILKPVLSVTLGLFTRSAARRRATSVNVNALWADVALLCPPARVILYDFSNSSAECYRSLVLFCSSTSSLIGRSGSIEPPPAVLDTCRNHARRSCVEDRKDTQWTIIVRVDGARSVSLDTRGSKGLVFRPRHYQRFEEHMYLSTSVYDLQHNFPTV